MRLKGLRLFSPEKRRSRRNLINTYEYLKGRGQMDGPSNRARGNRHQLEHRKFHLNMRKNFFTVKVTEH